VPSPLRCFRREPDEEDALDAEGSADMVDVFLNWR
jgi:hypothetical protein